MIYYFNIKRLSFYFINHNFKIIVVFNGLFLKENMYISQMHYQSFKSLQVISTLRGVKLGLFSTINV